MYVNAKTLDGVSDYNVGDTSWISKAEEGAKSGVSVEEYILFKTMTAENKAEDNALKQADVIDILDDMPLTDTERSYLFLTMYTEKNNPY